MMPLWYPAGAIVTLVFAGVIGLVAIRRAVRWRGKGFTTVKLRLADLIVASFPVALGIPVVITGASTTTPPYNHILCISGILMIVGGGILLVYRAAKYNADG